MRSAEPMSMLRGLALAVRQRGRDAVDVEPHAAHAEGRARAEAADRHLQVLRVVLAVLHLQARHGAQALGQVDLQPAVAQLLPSTRSTEPARRRGRRAARGGDRDLAQRARCPAGGIARGSLRLRRQRHRRRQQPGDRAARCAANLRARQLQLPRDEMERGKARHESSSWAGCVAETACRAQAARGTCQGALARRLRPPCGTGSTRTLSEASPAAVRVMPGLPCRPAVSAITSRLRLPSRFAHRCFDGAPRRHGRAVQSLLFNL